MPLPTATPIIFTTSKGKPSTNVLLYLSASPTLRMPNRTISSLSKRIPPIAMKRGGLNWDNKKGCSNYSPRKKQYSIFYNNTIKLLKTAPKRTASNIRCSLAPWLFTEASCDVTHISQPLIAEITKLNNSKNSFPNTGFIIIDIRIPAGILL